MTKKKNSAKVLNEGSHSEFLSEYVFNCKNIDSLKSIKINYFDSFKLSKKLNINIIAEIKSYLKLLKEMLIKLMLKVFLINI